MSCITSLACHVLYFYHNWLFFSRNFLGPRGHTCTFLNFQMTLFSILNSATTFNCYNILLFVGISSYEIILPVSNEVFPHSVLVAVQRGFAYVPTISVLQWRAEYLTNLKTSFLLHSPGCLWTRGPKCCYHKLEPLSRVLGLTSFIAYFNNKKDRYKMLPINNKIIPY